MSHLQLMVIYAAMLGVFFATLMARTWAEQLKLFAKVFFGLVGGAVLLGWVMYFFPSGPPAPIP